MFYVSLFRTNHIFQTIDNYQVHMFYVSLFRTNQIFQTIDKLTSSYVLCMSEANTKTCVCNPTICLYTVRQY